MDLLILIVGILLVWKFASTVAAVALAGRVKAEVMCEEVMMDAATERTQLVENFVANNKDKTIHNHEEILKMLKMKK